MNLLLNFAILLLVGFTQYRTVAQEPPPLQECDEGISVGTSPTQLTCEGGAKFSTSAPDAVVQKGTYDSTSTNQFTLTLSPALSFTEVIGCPVEVTPTDLTCNRAQIALASSNTGTDGARLKVGGNGGFGTVNWVCTTGSNYVNFFFFVEMVTDDAESDIDQEGAEFLAAVRTGGNTETTANTANMEVMKLQKFAQVTSSTEIYYVKENAGGTIYNDFIFKSPGTTIKLSSGRYDTIKGSNAIAGQGTGSDVCENAYMLKFSGGSQNQAEVIGKYVLLMVGLWAAEKLIHS